MTGTKPQTRIRRKANIDAPKETPDVAATVTRLENILELAVHAFNTSDFELDSEGWRPFAQNIRISIEVPVAGTVTLMGFKDLASQLDLWKSVTTEHPDMRLYCDNNLVTSVDLKEGRAKMIAMMRAKGTAPGIQRNLASTLTFRRREDGEWMVMSIDTMSGVDMLAMEGL